MLCMALLSMPTHATEYRVDSQRAYLDIAGKLKPGDTVILKNGDWSDFEIQFEGQGTEDQPITLTAEEKGQVRLTGKSNLSLSGEHLIVSGLIFTNGYTPSSAVISFRTAKDKLAFHSRVTETVIDNYNNPDKQESDYWVALYGQHNRFDHNHLTGKQNRGVTVAVRLDSKQSQQNHHRIDHNYFGYRPTFGSNGGETLRIGTSHYSLTDSHTLVESNYFEKTNGEVEIISVKSGKNTLRNNVFFEAQGTLTLRHGNGNLIENNIFLGNGVAHTGGIRVINKNQVVRNNYLEGLTGYRFGSGLTIMNGVPDSPINRYHQVDNALIENNTLINVDNIHLAAGSDAERTAVPVNSVMRNNLIINDHQQPFTVFDDISGIDFSGNVINKPVDKTMKKGFTQQKVKLQRNTSGLMQPVGNVEAGASQSLTKLDKAETGVSWYPKKPAQIPFESGSVHRVEASADALVKAIEQADDGDVLALEAGQYIIPKLLTVNKVLTIKSDSADTVKLSFQRTALFEIHDGGSLKLQGLTISGAESPDSAGNSVVRTKKWGMMNNYRLEMHNCVFQDININHSFDVFTSGKGAFADNIVLANNTFNDITGDILVLNREIEDLGIYNAEYVTVTGNTFSQVDGALVKLYRGGTDESTFGPHFTLTENTLKGVGTGSRNKTQASVFLHGVQVADISENTFTDSAPVIVEHTVGEPQTRITKNTFARTPAPAVEELRVTGPHTAIIKNNNIVKGKGK